MSKHDYYYNQPYSYFPSHLPERDFRRSVGPAIEPVDMQGMKDQVNYYDHNQDVLLNEKIIAAREYTEMYTWRALITQTWVAHFSAFANYLKLPNPPLQSIDSVEYLDANGVYQTVASSVYTIDIANEPGRLLLAYNQQWPGTVVHPQAVRITYKCGYGDTADDVPMLLRESIKTYAAYLFVNREGVAEPPDVVNRVLNQYIIPYC